MFKKKKNIASVIKLKLLQSGDYFESSKWALNVIACIFIRGTFTEGDLPVGKEKAMW